MIGRPLRVLFLHATRNRANEYTVHLRLAKQVDPSVVDTYFIWQATTHDPAKHLELMLPEEKVFFWDFGRNIDLQPAPSKFMRALMMLARAPASLYFLSRKIQEIQPDVISTTQQRYEVFLGRLFSWLYGIPHLIHICYYIGPWLGILAYQIIRTNKHLFASCEFVRQTGLQAGIPAERIETMHHMADIESYEIPKQREWLRQEFGWLPDTPVIVGAARLDEGKGFLRLVEAFKRVHEQMPEARLLICGEASPGTNHDGRIRDRVREYGLDEVVTFAGYREDLPRIFSGMDVFCQPMQYDASSLVFLDAMAAGVPVVAVRSGSIPEVVVDGETGLLSELGDHDALAENILKVLRNPELSQRLGKAARQRVERVFSPTAIAKAWTEKLLRWFDSNHSRAKISRWIVLVMGVFSWIDQGNLPVK